MKILHFATAGLIMYAVLLSCAYNDINDVPDVIKSTDEDLYMEAIGKDYTYYKGGQLLSPASASPHGSFKLRFNDIAWSALDNKEELPVGKVFPEGSVIVKEVHTGGTIAVYAVMKKTGRDINNGNGWLWSEYSANGSTLFGITRKGDGCISCHAQTGNRDLVRTFNLH